MIIVGASGYFLLLDSNSSIENQPRVIASPTSLPDGYVPKKLKPLTSNSIEITGVLKEGCSPEYLAISSNNVTYTFQTNETIKSAFLGKEIIANISESTTEEACGTTYKLGAIRDRLDNIYILGQTICLPPVDPRDDNCWEGLKSQSADYYTISSFPEVHVENFDLIIVSGTLDKGYEYSYPGQKGTINITNRNLLTKDAYK